MASVSESGCVMNELVAVVVCSDSACRDCQPAIKKENSRIDSFTECDLVSSISCSDEVFMTTLPGASRGMPSGVQTCMKTQQASASFVSVSSMYNRSEEHTS